MLLLKHRYNIGYAKTRASFEEIQEAAKAADIHNQILSFPDGKQRESNLIFSLIVPNY